MIQPGTLQCFDHILADRCQDPDCELHCIEVGLAEGTVTPDQFAFWLAGISFLPEGDSVREMAFRDAREFLARYRPA